MPNKYQLVNEMANETLKEITQSGESWIRFLNTASSNYKYSFNEQVLIYAQNPNATACATILYRSGIDIRTIQELLGHVHIDTTEIYVHLYDKKVMDSMLSHPLAHFMMSDALVDCA